MSNEAIVPVVAGENPLILYWPSNSPTTTAALTANLVCRVLFGSIASLVCLVPLRILHKNGEFAAVVFITTTVVKNILTVVNALIWHDNDFENWWPGYVLCDVFPYIQHFISMLFITCQLAIVRNVAHQVGLLRANPLTAREKRRRNLGQALVMFPFPILQVILTWLLTFQRYAIGTLIGCAWVGYPTWVYIVFFLVPPLVAAIIAAWYAILTYVRYRELAKATGAALSANRRATDRAARTRRRLYLMVVSVLIPFFPVVLTLTVLNVLDLKELKPYDYNSIHSHAEPYPWNTIVYLHSETMDFALLNVAWIPILSVIPIFGFFGTTKAALNDYRRVLVFLGFGRIFPRLYQEYDPDRRTGDSSNGSSRFGSAVSGTGKSPFKVISLTSSFRMLAKNTNSGSKATGHELQSMDGTVSHDVESGQPSSSSKAPAAVEDPIVEIPHRNPWLMRTNLNFPVIPFPFSGRNKSKERIKNSSQVSLNSFSNNQAGRVSPHVRTRVWHEEHSNSRDPRDDDEDSRSVASAHGVIVETHMIRETHTSENQR